jgi:hypothetical protein
MPLVLHELTSYAIPVVFFFNFVRLVRYHLKTLKSPLSREGAKVAKK